MEKEKLIAYIKQLDGRAENYYQEWKFCQDHKFELEAKLKRELYDMLHNLAIEMAVEFEVSA